MSHFRNDWNDSGLPPETKVTRPDEVAAHTPEICERLAAYYDASKKEFLWKNSSGRWLPLGSGDFKMFLRSKGIRHKVAPEEHVSPVEQILLWLKDNRDVRYAGPLAGKMAGFYEESGTRYLVTDSPKLLTPVEGDWSTIQRLLEGLLMSDLHYGTLQLHTFFGWLKVAVEALAKGKTQPGQVLVLAGPVQCGKSLLQMLLTQILGGRAAKPWRYMAGRTDFNADLFQAEHLMLEDEQASTDYRTRMSLAAHFKGVAVNEQHSCHGKNKDALLLSPFWRLSVSVNDEPENLLVLPPLTEDIADKIILLKCTKPTEVFPTGTAEKRAEYGTRLRSELPAFLRFLECWNPPVSLRSERFGIREFHHPELLARLDSLAPEAQLLELIDLQLWRGGGSQWEGTAQELQRELTSSLSTVQFEARKLLNWPSACGTYLARLAEKPAPRVVSRRTGQRRGWLIYPPAENEG